MNWVILINHMDWLEMCEKYMIDLFDRNVESRLCRSANLRMEAIKYDEKVLIVKNNSIMDINDVFNKMINDPYISFKNREGRDLNQLLSVLRGEEIIYVLKRGRYYFALIYGRLG